MSVEGHSREQWGTRIGLVLAMAGNAVISGLITSRKTGDRVFVIALPVWKGRRVCGVMGGAIRLSAFSALFVEAFRRGEAGFAFLTDDRGRVIATSGGARAKLTDIGAHGFGREILSKRSGSITFLLAGVHRCAAFQHLSPVPWVFVETQSLDEAFAGIDDARAFCVDFFGWHNGEHRHSGIGFHTPASVYYGTATEIRARLVETCHLGFPIVLVPVVDDLGRFHGAIFAGG